MTRARRWLAVCLLTTPLSVAVIDRACWQGSGFPPPHLRPAARRAAASPVAQPSGPSWRNVVALLVNGPAEPAMHHARYWNNTSLVFMALRARGVERLVVLQSDGRSPAPDRQTRSFLGLVGTGHLVDSPQDLDADGRGDVDGPAAVDAFGGALRSVGRTLGPDDRLLVFLTGHGQLRLRGGFGSAALFWDRGELRGRDLDRLIRDALPPGAWVAIVATQCHSDLFLGEVTRPRTLLVASGRPLWIWSTADYSVFPYHLAGALLGRDPATGDPTAGGPASTLRDAVVRAAARDHTPEWPRARVTPGDAPVPMPF